MVDIDPYFFHENFKKGVRMYMAEKGIEKLKEAAASLEINYMTLYKIMNSSNKPTIEQCVILCTKANYSANWLLLNRGEPKIKVEATLDKIYNELKALKNLKKQG